MDFGGVCTFFCHEFPICSEQTSIQVSPGIASYNKGLYLCKKTKQNIYPAVSKILFLGKTVNIPIVPQWSFSPHFQILSYKISTLKSLSDWVLCPDHTEVRTLDANLSGLNKVCSIWLRLFKFSFYFFLQT